MKKSLITIIFFSCVFFTLNLHSQPFSNLERCLLIIHEEYDKSVFMAKRSLSRELKSCYHFPVSEKFYKCQDLANKTYEKKEKGLKRMLNRKKRACYKYPWIFVSSK